MLACGLALVPLGFGGFGGLVNMSYAMNAMVHNTSWVTAHFHLSQRRVEEIRALTPGRTFTNVNKSLAKARARIRRTRDARR